jgi:hypothetical protein
MTEASARAALDRLLAGRSLHTDGRFTGSNLAKEAGMSRSTLYATFRPLVDELLAHRTQLAERNVGPADRNLATVARLRGELQAERAKARKDLREREEARAQVESLANRVVVLDEHARRLEENLKRLRDARVVTDIRSQRGVR